MVEVLEIPRVPSIECFDEKVLEAMQETQVLIIEQPPFPSVKKLDEIVRRTKETGRAISELIVGSEYVHERDKLRVRSGFPKHVDGYVPHYWQINTSVTRWVAPKKGKVYGARFRLDVFELDQPFPEGFFGNLTLQDTSPENYDSSFCLHSDLHARRRGILNKLEQEGFNEPRQIKRYEGFLESGATIVFINGIGMGSTNLVIHSTRSAVLDADDGIIEPYRLFNRIASIGRVQTDGRDIVEVR